MRKQLFTPTPQGIRPHDEGWLDLDSAAMVEVTSEEKDYPVEFVLSQDKSGAGVPTILAPKPSG